MTASVRAPGRVLALDPGAVRIGVAVSDSARALAMPLPAIPGGPDAPTRCADLARDESAVTVVVGLPLRLDGTRGEAAELAARFADDVCSALGDADIDVVLCDERLTTVTAAARLRDAGVSSRSARERIDSAAAVVLLEVWLTS